MSRRRYSRVIVESSSESEQEEEYCVETILNKRKRHGRVEYFLKWIGYSESENTWEPVENLKCPELIEEFEEKLRLKKKKEKEERDRKRSIARSTAKRGVSSVAGPSSSLAGPSSSIAGPSTSTSVIPRTLSIRPIKLEKLEASDFNVEPSNVPTSVPTSMPTLVVTKQENDVNLDINEPPKIAEKIIGATDADGVLMFLIKWVGLNHADLVVAKEANIMCPQVVIQFYEERLTWNLPSGASRGRGRGINITQVAPKNTARGTDQD